MPLRQKQDEYLSLCMDCFNDETSQIKILNLDGALHALVAGLKPRQFL